MCRLLGVVAPEPTRLADQLVSEIKPFTDLAAIHCDGWGISYWSDRDDLVTCKAPETALSSTTYRRAIDQACTDAAILHLRKASAGMANVATNTHPFAAGSVAFAHNGYFSPLGPVEQLVEASAPRTYEGATDSERYFALVLAGIRRGPPAEALSKAVTEIAAAAEVVSLNALLLTHDALYAIAYYDEQVIEAQDGDIASWALKYRVEGETVVVASSGWDQEAPHWDVLANRSVLEVRRKDRRITVHKLSGSPPRNLSSQVRQ